MKHNKALKGNETDIETETYWKWYMWTQSKLLANKQDRF